MAERRWWIRGALVALAFEQLVSGVWAAVDPRGWYDGYPGLGRHWVSVDGPFNQHLAVDAGSGWLGIGVILLIAAIWARREAIQLALAAFLVSTLPHLLYHATHRPEPLGTVDDVMSVGGLAFMAAVSAICLIALGRRPSVTAGRTQVDEKVRA
jgi:hypothetical protein